MISHARENIPSRTYSLSKFVEEDVEMFALLAKPKFEEDGSLLDDVVVVVVVTQTAVSIASKASAAAARASSLP
jgi:hypothetical protein